MKSGLTLFAVLFAVLLVHAYARTDRLSQGSYEGTVEALFEEPHPGIYVPRGADTGPGRPAWVHVRFDEPLQDGRRFAVAALAPQQRVQAGDRVEMRFGDPSAFGAQGPDHNLVVRVVGGRNDGLARAR
jgi:hypothetical protein